MTDNAPKMPTPPAGFNPDAGEFQNVTKERHTQVPKSSHRAGEHRLESLLALGVLTLYLSNKTGWKIPNATKIASEWNEGAARVRKAIADIERAGFLVRFRKQGDGGHWKTITVISADPKSLNDIRQYAQELTGYQESAAAARKAAGKSGAGRAGQVARALPEPPPETDDDEYPQVGPDDSSRDPVHRDPVHRDSDQRDLTDQETMEETFKETKNPPPSSVGNSLPRVHEDAKGEFDEETRAALSAAYRHAVEVRKPSNDWSENAVRDAMKKYLAEGHAPRDVAAAMIRAADGDRTHPGGIGYLLAQAKTPAVVEPAWASGPVKYVDPTTPMCRKHQGEPEHACGKCKSDAFTDPADLQRAQGPTMSAADARRLARESLRHRSSTAPRRRVLLQDTAVATGPAPERAGALFGMLQDSSS